jgi:VanZ family protein
MSRSVARLAIARPKSVLAINPWRDRLQSTRPILFHHRRLRQRACLMDTTVDEHRFWSPARRRVVFALCLAVMTGGTHWPSELGGVQTDHLDKIVHFAAFTVLGWLAAWAFDFGKRSRIERFAVILFSIALYAALDEITQPYVGRQCDPLDWLADIAGAMGGMAIYATMSRRSANL